MKEKIINGIIEREGGYVDDPLDSGGKTHWGITEKVAREWGYTGEMEDMPREEAFAIYAALYWDSNDLTAISSLSVKIAEEIADTGVNCGVKLAATFLQRCLNVLNNRGVLYQDLRVDGDIGPKTLTALKEYLEIRGEEGEVVLCRMLDSLQGNHYITLAERRGKDERFVYGWMRERVG